MNLQWYPGHMEKARRLMNERLKDVDLVIELVDARIPLSSRNPLLNHLSQNKAKLLLLTKKDKADAMVSMGWLKYFAEKGEEALLVNVLKDNMPDIVLPKIKEILQPKILRAQRRGIINKTLRIMVVGIPNVGKSTFINRLSKSNLRVENRPGVTRDISLISLGNGLELLDTPGVLWPKFENEDIAKRIALIGSINREIVDNFNLALFAINYLNQAYPSFLSTFYNVKADNDLAYLRAIGSTKQLLKEKQEIDLEKTAEFLLQDLRNNKKICLSYEKPIKE